MCEENIYITNVRVRKNIDKKLFNFILVLLVWIILIILSIYLINFISLAVILTFIIIFMIIPILNYQYKNISKFKENNSFVIKKIKFNVIDKELYVNNIKLKTIKAKNKIIVENNKGYTKFLGIIEEPYLDGFINFLNDKNIKFN